jgi:hypothetical protein
MTQHVNQLIKAFPVHPFVARMISATWRAHNNCGNACLVVVRGVTGAAGDDLAAPFARNGPNTPFKGGYARMAHIALYCWEERPHVPGNAVAGADFSYSFL